MPDVITRQQKRAQVAYSCVSEVRANKKEYKQLAKRFPALVHTCGLAQATAFVTAKEEKVGKPYLSHLSLVMNLKKGEDISEISRTAPLREYQYLTYEVTESATWLKRYCEALIQEED